MASSTNTTTKDQQSILNNSALRNYYESWDSRIVYKVIMGGTQHFGYWDKDTYWPFPLTPQLRRMEEKLLEIINLPRGSQILDAGCGVGHVTRYFAQHGMRMLGIDIIDWAIDDARTVAQDADLSQAQMRIEKMDYHDLSSIQDSSLDGVYTMQSLSHAYDPKRAMAEFYRVTRPGGRIAMVEVERKTPNTLDDPNDQLTQVMKMVNEYTVMPTNEAAHFDYFKGLLEEAGYTNIEVEDWQSNIMPIIRLFYVLVAVPYYLLKSFGIEKWFINMICAASAFLGRDRWRFVAITATKPGGRVETTKTK
ncbi:methyltransferase type 11 [Fusarium sporotrichioides]|uniref:Methyltransferase type 11 n=1 Tax=Fusarium sporotrichioides TaxID=5514 RepID=A0A395SAP0_FUSSP|nr:methyltransferase type 11 [Fusarium sporotrichioides]